MKLKEIFDQLTYGELSQLNIGGGADGAITEANYPKILAHINLGMTALYKRFTLKEGRIRVQLVPGITMYLLNSKFAATNRRSREAVKYIQDTEANPFEDDVQKVERVLTDAGYEFHLNNEAEPYSVFTPSLHSIRMPLAVVNQSIDLPADLKTQGVEIVYRAGHKNIEVGVGFFDPARVEVDLPDTHLEALLLFVASRIHNPIGMQNEFNAGNNYAAKYEQACQVLEALNLQVDVGSQSTALVRNGWV